MTPNNKIIINQNKGINNVFLYQDDELVEQYQERLDGKRLEGNIYLGEVKNIIKGMQSAFIDIGTEKNALIHIKDIMPKVSNITGNNEVDVMQHDINEYIKPNENILVQIKRDSSDTKGARVTKDIKLVGNYTVLMPFSNFITLSQKIEDEKERKRLAKSVEEYTKKSDYGIIVRTSAIGVDNKIIKQDVEKLINIWNDIKEKQKEQKAPAKLYSNNGIIGKLITDFEPLGVKIYSNNEILVEKLKKTYKDISIELDETIDLEIEEKKKIWLKCGGFITIDKTEALIAIDVNSGKCLGKRELEETVFKVNKEAATEIAKQMRLRDLGGIIIIDFIDMEREENRNKIRKVMQEALAKDRSKVQIIEFTKLGLLEVTRKNIFRK